MRVVLVAIVEKDTVEAHPMVQLQVEALIVAVDLMKTVRAALEVEESGEGAGVEVNEGEEEEIALNPSIP